MLLDNYQSCSVIGNNINEFNSFLDNVVSECHEENSNKLPKVDIKKPLIKNEKDLAYEIGCKIYEKSLKFKTDNDYDKQEENKKVELSEKFTEEIEDKNYSKIFSLIIKFMFNLNLFDEKGYYDYLTYYFNVPDQERNSNVHANVKIHCKYIYYVYYQVLLRNNNSNGKKKDKIEVIKSKAEKLENNIYNSTIKQYENIMEAIKQKQCKCGQPQENEAT